MNEMKWFFIAIIFIVIGGFIAETYADHAKSECRIAAIQKNLTAEQIDKICT